MSRTRAAVFVLLAVASTTLAGCGLLVPLIIAEVADDDDEPPPPPPPVPDSSSSSSGSSSGAADASDAEADVIEADVANDVAVDAPKGTCGPGGCACSGGGATCTKACTGGVGCEFVCEGSYTACVFDCPAGGCTLKHTSGAQVTFTCAGGGCSVIATGVGSAELRCPGNGCTMDCSGDGDCEITQCTMNCAAGCNGGGLCTNTCNDPTCSP